MYEMDNPTVFFKPTQRGAERAAHPPNDSLLHAYFRLNLAHANELLKGGLYTKDLLYHQIPEYFRVVEKGSKRIRAGEDGAYFCEWVKRKVFRKVIGRLNMVESRDCQANALRSLLLLCPGPTSFEHLRTVVDLHEGVPVLDAQGNTTCTIQDAIAALLGSDLDIYHITTLRDIAKQGDGRPLHTFAAMVAGEHMQDPFAVFLACTEELSVGLAARLQHLSRQTNQHALLQAMAVLKLEEHLLLSNVRLDDVDPRFRSTMLKPHILATLTTLGARADLAPELRAAQDFNPEEEARHAVAQEALLNPDQRRMYDAIVASCDDRCKQDGGDPSTGRVFMIDARAGTGKTFVLQTLLQREKSKGRGPISCATAGVAALLLPDCKTFHSTWKYPVNFTGRTPSLGISTTPGNGHFEWIKAANLLVFDEALMLRAQMLDTVDMWLRRELGDDRPFAGKVVVLAGCWRQTTPVIKGGTAADIIGNYLFNAKCWPHARRYTLQTSMRIQQAAAALPVGREDDAHKLDTYLQMVGQGDVQPLEWTTGGSVPRQQYVKPHTHSVTLPPTARTVHTTEDLLDDVYPDYLANGCISAHDDPATKQAKAAWVRDRLILTPTNAAVQEVNDLALSRLPGDSIEFLSLDKVEEVNPLVGPEILNTQTCSGLPDHSLILKPGMPLICLRNMFQLDVCNDTRVVLEAVVGEGRGTCLKCRVCSGRRANEIVYLFQMKMNQMPGRDSDFGFTWSRRQFPVKPAFACTINKAQGATVQRLGLLLDDPEMQCFCHGQLYTAISRTGDPTGLAVLLPSGQQMPATHNVVFQRIVLSMTIGLANNGDDNVVADDNDDTILRFDPDGCTEEHETEFLSGKAGAGDMNVDMNDLDNLGTYDTEHHDWTQSRDMNVDMNDLNNLGTYATQQHPTAGILNTLNDHNDCEDLNDLNRLDEYDDHTLTDRHNPQLTDPFVRDDP